MINCFSEEESSSLSSMLASPTPENTLSYKIFISKDKSICRKFQVKFSVVRLKAENNPGIKSSLVFLNQTRAILPELHKSGQLLEGSKWDIFSIFSRDFCRPITAALITQLVQVFLVQ
uniref:Uncharacterized protein n=1 Tax=Micrurus carvalhoi TaxID=3147026 RepID=A0A2H6N3I8_9SAUR